MNFTFGLFWLRVLILTPRDSGLRNFHFKKATGNSGVHAVGDIEVRASKIQIPCFVESKVFVRYTIILYATKKKKCGEPNPDLRHVT